MLQRRRALASVRQTIMYTTPLPLTKFPVDSLSMLAAAMAVFHQLLVFGRSGQSRMLASTGCAATILVVSVVHVVYSDFILHSLLFASLLLGVAWQTVEKTKVLKDRKLQDGIWSLARLGAGMS